MASKPELFQHVFSFPENENYPQAVEDLKTCLRRHQEHLPDDSRCIAEAHYQVR